MSKVTKNQLAVIHILKNEYGVTEYEQLLENNFGVTSSKELSEEQAEKFIHLLNYNYSEEYKRGYNYGIKRLLSMFSLKEQFIKLLDTKHNRVPTTYELYMFDNLDVELQKQMLIDLF